MSDIKVDAPTVTNDDGTGQTGTVGNAAWYNALLDAINLQVLDAGNPGVKPRDTFAEIIAARGSKASVDARLDVSLNEDGTPKPIAGQVTAAQLAQQYATNWLQNDDFLIWPAGDAAAPAGWTLATLTAARTGTGLGDTNTKVGPYSVKLTRASADGYLLQSLLNGTSFLANGLHLRGRTFGFGCWVKSSVASVARVRLYDGIGSTSTLYHNGDGTWQFLSAVHTLSGSATQLSLLLEVLNSSGDGYFSGAVALPSGVAPTDWVPCPKVYGTMFFSVPGTLATGTFNGIYRIARPTLIKDVALFVKTAPASQPIIVDVNHYDGSAWQSMFSTRPQIAAGAQFGGAVPDGTYRYRGFLGLAGAVAITDATLSFDIDQVGIGTTGVDLYVHVRALQYARPQEDLLDPADT